MVSKKRILLPLAILTILTLIGYLVVRRWSETPYGKLDPKTAVLLKYIEFKGIDLFEEGRSIAQIREFSAKNSALLRPTAVVVKEVVDRTIPGPDGRIPVRIYTPEGDERFPIIIYYHGGGWIIGNLDSHDGICRLLANKVKAVVVSVDYRLAPEHPFPAAFNDSYAALRWVSKNGSLLGGESSLIFVAGDSAGGNLAAAVSLASRNRNGPTIRGQILIYPATDLSRFETDSHNYFQKGYYLTRRYMERFRALYLPDPREWANVYASPALAKDVSNLPAAFVLTAQFDVLRDEGEMYAKRLREAGVPVKSVRVEGVLHGFFSMGRVFGQFDESIVDIAEFVQSKRRSEIPE